MRWRSLAAMLVLAGAARAEDRAALLARAPALALDGPVAPLAAPVEVTRAGWGPFRRLCVARTMIRPADGQEVATSPPQCIEVVEAREEAGTWRLSLQTAPLQGGVRVGFSTSRDAAGRVGEATVAVPGGQAPPTPEQMARLRAIFRLAVLAHGIERTTIAPGGAFRMPLPVGEVDPAMQVEGGGFSCLAEGEGAVGGRRVVVAACGAPSRSEISPGRAMTIDVAGRFAIDVETGMVLRHGYASFLVVEADPRGSMGRMEMRGVSRQTLE